MKDRWLVQPADSHRRHRSHKLRCCLLGKHGTEQRGNGVLSFERVDKKGFFASRIIPVEKMACNPEGLFLLSKCMVLLNTIGYTNKLERSEQHSEQPSSRVFCDEADISQVASGGQHLGRRPSAVRGIRRADAACPVDIWKKSVCLC